MTKRTYEKALKDLPVWARTALASDQPLYFATNYEHKVDKISRNYISDSLWVLSDLGCEMQFSVMKMDNLFLSIMSNKKEDWDIIVRMFNREYNQPEKQMEELFDEILHDENDDDHFPVLGDVADPQDIE